MRLDIFIKNKENISRTKALQYIQNGNVFINGQKVEKASTIVKDADKIELQKAEIEFVSLGGYKLYKAIQTFQTTVQNKIFADIGASTGGFTDCLLQLGAKYVYAVDVGENQLAEKLKKDKRILIMDKRNAKNLKKDDFFHLLDGVVVDVSFISLKHIFPIVSKIVESKKEIYCLIKPQFETEGKWLNKHGIVKDKQKRYDVIRKICQIAESFQLYLHNFIATQRSLQKNIEYMAYFRKDIPTLLSLEDKLKEFYQYE